MEWWRRGEEEGEREKEGGRERERKREREKEGGREGERKREIERAARISDGEGGCVEGERERH